MNNKTLASATIAFAISALCFWSGISSSAEVSSMNRAPATPPFWPPAPKNMVYRDGNVSFLTGGAATVYQVPANKWFVLTAYSTGTGRSLVETIGGSTTVKVGGEFLGTNDGSGSETGGVRPQVEPPLGIAFQPGSEVQMSGPGGSLQFALSGYLVNKEDLVIRRPWPPHPRNVVSVDSENLPGFDPNNGHPLAPSASLRLFSVPINKFFVVTGVWSKGNTGSSGVAPLAEDFGGVITTKVSRQYLGSSYGGTGVPLPLDMRAPLGVTFRPGSDVVIHNPGGTQTFALFVGLMGYLVDA